VFRQKISKVKDMPKLTQILNLLNTNPQKLIVLYKRSYIKKLKLLEKKKAQKI